MIYTVGDVIALFFVGLFVILLGIAWAHETIRTRWRKWRSRSLP